jgi:SPP1 family predicted phage head-tail adaptor
LVVSDLGLDAGTLDRRISIERPTVTYDAKNRPVTGWALVKSVRASWRRATANERLAAAQTSAQVTDVFEVRWSSTMASIDPKCRLLFEGRTYDISEVTPIGRRQGLLIRAAARADL